MHRQLLQGYAETGASGDIHLASPAEVHQDVVPAELARVLMKAWDVSAGLTAGQELAEEVTATFDRVFGLRFIGSFDGAVQYSPTMHELKLVLMSPI